MRRAMMSPMSPEPKIKMCIRDRLQTVGTQIREALELHQGLKGVAAQEKAIEILSDVGILEPEKRVKDYPHQFSGGMRQQMCIRDSPATKEAG